MNTYIKLYDWTTKTGLDLKERVIFSLIHQYSEGKNIGYWAGYKAMSDKVGIPKSKCKAIVQKLKDIGAVIERRGQVEQITRIILSSNPDFTVKFVSSRESA